MVVAVEAKCSVTDKHGNPVVLTAGVLPNGVVYDLSTDLLECNQPQSCQQWKIVGCAKVECTNHESCREAQFVNTNSIFCFWSSACLGARLQQSGQVTCGGLTVARNFCSQAVIQTHATVRCAGPGACVSASEADKLTVQVGANGQVRCGNMITEKDPSCQHLLVEVNHAKRACIQKQTEMDRGCAVRCMNVWDCKTDTIQFKVSN